MPQLSFGIVFRIWLLSQVSFFVVTVSFWGCSGGQLPPPPPGGREILRINGYLGSGEPLPPGDRDLRLYIDSSMSMRGFVGDSGSAYRATLDALLDGAATSGYKLKLYSFAEDVTVLDNGISNLELLEPGFYRGLRTSFPNLLRHAGLDGKPGGAVVIVSDLVQSDSGAQRELASAFRQLSADWREVVLLATRSAFQGKYWVEGQRARGAVLNLELRGSTPENGRPFYVLLLAKNRHVIDEVRNLLLPDYSNVDWREFDASSPALKTDVVQFVPPEVSSEAAFNLYAVPETFRVDSRSKGSIISFVQTSWGAKDTAPLRTRLTFENSDPAESLRWLEKLNFYVKRRVYSNGKWGHPEVVDVVVEAKFIPSERALDITYQMPRPAPNSWDVYSIKIRPGLGNLRTPAWSQDWATLDDGVVSLANKTLKLDLFVDAMNRAIRENVPFAEQIILLGRGEK